MFVCDRDELRIQALKAFQNVFGADAAEVFKKPDGTNNAKNARIHIATYQTLGVDQEDGTASFLTTHYPLDFFSHLIIDECHRSARGKWSLLLTRNPAAVQVGLTATPRQLFEKLCQVTEVKCEPDPWQSPALPEDHVLAAETAAPYAVKGADAPSILTKEARAPSKRRSSSARAIAMPMMWRSA